MRQGGKELRGEAPLAFVFHVKELLGHENLETLKHYIKLTIEWVLTEVGML